MKTRAAFPARVLRCAGAPTAVGGLPPRWRRQGSVPPSGKSARRRQLGPDPDRMPSRRARARPNGAPPPGPQEPPRLAGAPGGLVEEREPWRDRRPTHGRRRPPRVPCVPPEAIRCILRALRCLCALALRVRWLGRRVAADRAADALPPLDADLAFLASAATPSTAPPLPSCCAICRRRSNVSASLVLHGPPEPPFDPGLSRGSIAAPAPPWTIRLRVSIASNEPRRRRRGDARVVKNERNGARCHSLLGLRDFGAGIRNFAPSRRVPSAKERRRRPSSTPLRRIRWPRRRRTRGRPPRPSGSSPPSPGRPEWAPPRSCCR